MLTVDSGPLTSEDKPLSFSTDSEKEQGISFFTFLNKLNSSHLFPNKITCNKLTKDITVVLNSKLVKLIFALGILLEMKTTQPIIAVAPSSVLLHPQEEAVRIRMAARQKQVILNFYF